MGVKVSRPPRNPAGAVCLGAVGVGILIGVPVAVTYAMVRPSASLPVIQEPTPQGPLVPAQNAFGATARNNYQVVLRKVRDASPLESCEPVDIRIGP